MTFGRFSGASDQRLEKDDRFGAFAHHGEERGQTQGQGRSFATFGRYDLSTDEVFPLFCLTLGSNPRADIEKSYNSEELEYPLQCVTHIVANYMLNSPCKNKTARQSH